MALFSMIFRLSKPKSELTLLSRRDVNDKRSWAKSGQTPVMYVKFYWNTETLIVYTLSITLSIDPQSFIIVIIWILRKFCLPPNLEGPEGTISCT